MTIGKKDCKPNKLPNFYNVFDVNESTRVKGCRSAKEI